MTYRIKRIAAAALVALLAAALTLSLVLGLLPVRADETAGTDADCTETGLHIEGFDNTTDSGFKTAYDAGSMEITSTELRQGDGAFRAAGQGIDTVGNANWQLAQQVDLTGYDLISFWLYVDDASLVSSDNFGDNQIVLTDTQNTAGKIYWRLTEIAGLEDGWNKVVLSMYEQSDGNAPSADTVQGYAHYENRDSLDLSKINYMRIYFVGLSQQVVTIFDDLHAHRSGGLLLESFDSDRDPYPTGSGATYDTSNKTQGDASFSTVGGGFNMDGAYNFEGVTSDTGIDISHYDALAFDIYLENAEGFINMSSGANQFQISDLYQETPNTSNIDSAKFFFTFEAYTDGLQDGWQTVVVPFSEMTYEGTDGYRIDLSSVKSFRIYFNALDTTNGNVTVKLDNLRAIEMWMQEEPAEPIESYTITDANSVTAGVFDGMTLDLSEKKEGTASLMTQISSATDLTAEFGPVESALSYTAGENELGLSFWLYLSDVSAANSVKVILSSSDLEDRFDLQWDVPDLTAGWNWITLRASEATSRHDVIDMNGLSRLTISVGAAAEVTVGLDRVRIVNTSVVSGWSDEPQNEAEELDPVSRTVVSNLDQTTETVFSNASVESLDQQEGRGAAILTTINGENEAIDWSISGLSLGRTDLLAVNYSLTNEFGITFWLYLPEEFAPDTFTVSMGSSVFGSENYASQGSIAFKIEVSALTKGSWNWVVLRASDAESVAADFNADALQWFLIRADLKEGNTTPQQFKLDRISVVNATDADAVAQPDPDAERVTVDPISGEIIIDCEDASMFGGNSLSEDRRQGNYSVQTSGRGFEISCSGLNIGQTDLTRDTIVLAMWVWVEDADYYAESGVNGQIELSSSGRADSDEIHWTLGPDGGYNAFSDLQDGWNWIVLYGTDAELDGTPDYDNLTWFRIYVNNVQNTTFRLDRVTLTNVYDTESYAMPDWESEVGPVDYGSIEGNGGFYLETPLSGDSFEVTVVTEIPGTSDWVLPTLLSIAAAVVVAAVVVAVVLVKKKKKAVSDGKTDGGDEE